MIPLRPRDHPPAHGRARGDARGADALVAAARRPSPAAPLDRHEPRRPRLPGGRAAVGGTARHGAAFAGAGRARHGDGSRFGHGQPLLLRPHRLLPAARVHGPDRERPARPLAAAARPAEHGGRRVAGDARAGAAREERCAVGARGRRRRHLARTGRGGLPGSRARAAPQRGGRPLAGTPPLRVPGTRRRRGRRRDRDPARGRHPLRRIAADGRSRSPSRTARGCSRREAGPSCSGSRCCRSS